MIDRMCFWNELPLSDRQILGRIGKRAHVHKGEVVFSAESPSLVIVMSGGWVRLQATSTSRARTVIDIAGPGDPVSGLHAIDPVAPPWLGHLGAITGVSLTAGQVLTIGKDQIGVTLDKLPGLKEALIRSVGAQLHLATQLRLGADLPVRPRLAQLLLTVAHRFGERKVPTGGPVLAIPLSQPDLAAWIVASPASVARALKAWRRDGVVATGYASLSILDVKRLRGEAMSTATPLWKPPLWG